MAARGFIPAIAGAWLCLAPAVVAAADATTCRVEKTDYAETGQLRMVAGAERNRVWVTATHNGLEIRKFTAKGGSSVIEFRFEDDIVILSLSPGRHTVSRNGTTVVLGQPEAVTEAHALLGNSSALFAARAMLSRYEQTSDLKGPSFSVLTAAALAAMLTGDHEAPLRLGERYLERYRGILRRVADDGSCYTTYEKEADAALSDYQACLKEASDNGWLYFLAMSQVCGTRYGLRAESAWFEYLKCLSPLSSISKIE